MEKKVVFRKLKYNDIDYYQVVDILSTDGKLSKENDQKDTDDIVYKNINFGSEKDEILIMNKIFKYHNAKEKKDFSILVEPSEIYDVRRYFHDIFNDFDLIPKNKLNIDQTIKFIKKYIKYHDDEIKELVNVIKSNLDVVDSDLNDEQKVKMKHNIILYGPSGYGKSSIMDKLQDCLDVPTVSIELGTDYNDNIRKTLSGLLSCSLGDVRAAEQGIVLIKDNFDSFESEEQALDVLENLVNTTGVSLNDLDIDLSKLTYVLEVNTEDNDLEYQSIYDQFQRFIYINDLDKEEICDIILNSPNGIIKSYETLLTSLHKKLVIEEDFVDYLIDKTKNETGGIKSLENYIEDMIKEQWGQKTIVLNKELVDQEVYDLEDEFQEMFDENHDKKEKTEIKETKKEVNIKSSSNEKFTLNRKKIKEKYNKFYAILKEDIKGQDQILGKVLYKVIQNDEFQNSNLTKEEKKERISHILIRGKSGTGKTFITSKIASMFPNKVFFTADCTEYTKAGYVGKSIDDILIGLLNRAGGNLEKAQKSILFLDEFDKLAVKNDERSDVGTGAVQEALLKLLEGNIYELESKSGYSVKSISFDTSELIVILAGAFEGLDKIIEERVNGANKPKVIGFSNEKKTDRYVDKSCTLDDLQKFGMQRQLLRRVSLPLELNELTKADYLDIMLNAKSSYFLMKIETMNMLGVNVVYDDNFVNKFIDVAYNMGYGVSSINILTERIFSNLEIKIIVNDYNKVILTEECIDNPEAVILETEEEKSLKLKK